MFKRAFIYTGGQIVPEHIDVFPAEGDLVIAADSGYDNAKRLGEKVGVLVGDLDSIKLDFTDEEAAGTLEVVRVKPEKDETDTQLAVNIALERGYGDIVIVGGFGSRIDHCLSNLSILEYLYDKGVNAYIVNGQNRARFIKNNSALIPRDKFYRYLSLIAVDELCRGVTVRGCKYPLTNARIKRGVQYAVSNEIEGNVALIEVRRGAVYIIESGD